MTDYNRTREIQLQEFASTDDPTLDQPLENIEGVNSLIFDHLVAEGYNTLRSLLQVTPEQLAAIPGISLELADKILEKIRKQRI